jgi:radical SAM protein with 4Fe4S-binding SPASM domain
VRIELTKNNYRNLDQLFKRAGGHINQDLIVVIKNSKEELLRFSDVVPFLYKLLDHEESFGIWLRGFPYCVLSKNSHDHIVPSDNGGEKIPQCKECFYYKKCSGFPLGYFNKYGKSEVMPIEDLPCEVMIEVEPRCNFNCQFCFNKVSFAKHGRDIKQLSTDYVKKIIDGIANNGIGVVRFTGGEPLLRPDIFELIKYAKNKNLEVRLNTNGSLITKNNILNFQGLVDNVLIPIENYESEIEDDLSGGKGVLDKKINAIKLLKKTGVPIVRIGTVALKKNIAQIKKLADFVLKLPIDQWEFYRPISINKGGFSWANIDVFIEELLKINKNQNCIISVANALPFCAVDDMNKINSVSSGALYDDGHNRLVVDPRKFVKPHYFMNENVGAPLDIVGAWNDIFMKKMRNLEYLPKNCNPCKFKSKCRGGSRYEAKKTNDDYTAPDPLARFIRNDLELTE